MASDFCWLFIDSVPPLVLRSAYFFLARLTFLSRRRRWHVPPKRWNFQSTWFRVSRDRNLRFCCFGFCFCFQSFESPMEDKNDANICGDWETKKGWVKVRKKCKPRVNIQRSMSGPNTNCLTGILYSKHCHAVNKPKSIFIAKCNLQAVKNMWNAKYGLLCFAMVLKVEGSVSPRHGASSVE